MLHDVWLQAYALNVVQEANNQWQALVGKANDSGVAW